MQFTYDGVSNAFLMDNTDIRFANNVKIGGKQLIYGISFNNNPTVQDVWNTTPVWGFPYASSSVAPTPAAGAVIDGGLGSQVGGLGIYAYWNNLIYGEVNFYRTAANGYPQFLSAGTHVDSLVDGVAPYWRLYLQHQWGKNTFMLGHYGMVTNIFPQGQTRGNSDQFTISPLTPSINTLPRNTSSLLLPPGFTKFRIGMPVLLGQHRQPLRYPGYFRVNANYFYWSHYGTFGGKWPISTPSAAGMCGLYASDPVGGSSNGRPNSNGFILQATTCRRCGTGAPRLWCNTPFIIISMGPAATTTASGGAPAPTTRSIF